MTHRSLKQLMLCIKLNYLSDCWLMRSSLVECAGLVLFRWKCGLLFCGPGSCWRSPALMSVWQWGNTEWWRKMAVYLYRKHASKTVVQIQHRPPRACPTVGIKHKCGALRILGHLRECLNPPPTPTTTHSLFLFLLPLSSSFPLSLFLVALTPIYPPQPPPPPECTLVFKNTTV